MSKLLIGAKEAKVITDLHLESKETGQIIREVHIIADPDPLSFILTNAKHWSFGLGTKVGNKVSITSTRNVHLDEPQGYDILVQLLIKYVYN